MRQISILLVGYPQSTLTKGVEIIVINKIYNATIYFRLSLTEDISVNDGTIDESGSIQTQKMILKKYCKDNNLRVNHIYIDDGYSGLNFNKPAFKRMIDNIDDEIYHQLLNKYITEKKDLQNKLDLI